MHQLSLPSTPDLVVIACSKGKLERPAPAEQLYTGSLFVLALAAARSFVDDTRIRVLSARYGFVPLDRELAPYDQRWWATGRMPSLLRKQAVAQNIAGAKSVLSLCPGEYWLRVQQIWPHAVDGFAGCRGIGEQRHVLAGIKKSGAMR